MVRPRVSLIIGVLLAGLLLSGCGSNSKKLEGSKKPLVVTTSAIVGDLVRGLGGESIEVSLLVPNGYDSHSYEPKPSELALLSEADLIVLPDAGLNDVITGLVKLSGDSERILDLNAVSLSKDEFIYREIGNASSYNPHTWTSPLLLAKWLTPLMEEISALKGVDGLLVERNLAGMLTEIEVLDTEIRESISKIKVENRKLVVYHDAWVYFGREYNIPIIGAIQAVTFAEPSASELAAMAQQIRAEKVPAFFGSEVFPSDVLEALEKETGALYIPNLADDMLPGEIGDATHSYIGMMRANLALMAKGLVG